MDHLNQKTILSNTECDVIVDIIIKNESNIKSLGEDIYEGTREDSITGRYHVFNCLNISKINKILEPKLIELFKELKLEYPIYVQCWANIYRKGDYIEYHSHTQNDILYRNNILSANIFLLGNTKPGTTYYFDHSPVDVENKVGEICLFSPTLFHSVRPYKKNDIRVTLGLDIFFGKIFENNFYFNTNKSRYYKLS